MQKNMKNIRLAGLMLALNLLWCGKITAEDIVIVHGLWKLTYVEADKSFKLNSQKTDGTYRPVFIGSEPEATYDNAAGESRSVNTQSFSEMTYTETPVSDEFGTGVCHTFTFTEPDNGDEVSMAQHFYFYDNQDYLIADLSLTGGETIRSNYLAPVSVNSAYTLFLSDNDNRMLKVPFDNDGFVRYHKYHINGEMTSYEVTALYEGQSRNGLVVGSVEHDHWKSAVSVNASNNGKLEQIKVFSGVSNSETRDVLPHGKIEGLTVSSARMFVGFYDDWRLGLEAFGKANTLVQPMRDNWTGGTPFGWQSWGVMSDKNSFETDVDISNYYHDVLKPAGFCNNQGLNIISIDSWDNLSAQQKEELNEVCAENGQIAGTYCSPFALWWNADMLDNKLDGQTIYTARECVLKVNGEPYMLDGAYCLDPTHPGVKANIAWQLRNIKARGFKYIKVDFTSNGMVQADSYYNPEVKTAVEAYNEGFQYFIKKADEGEPMFVALSIAPIFPYQYGNSRRIACDTWGKIDQTEYSMNAISGGWWTNQFYQYNDPDHLVFVGNDLIKETIGENRARMTNGAVSGMLLVADNFSLTDESGRGNAELSRERAETIMMNADVNKMADLGRSFMPVYGYEEYNGNDNAAECCFMYHTPEYLYVAVFNYTYVVSNGSIPLSLLDIENTEFDEVKELWSGELLTDVKDQLSYSVPGRDAKIYRFHKIGGTGVDESECNERKQAEVRIEGGREIAVSANEPMRDISLFDVSGSQILRLTQDGSAEARFVCPPVTGAVLVRVGYDDGKTETHKILVP